jgi:hypothetical protein
MRISHSLPLVGSLQFGFSGPVDRHVYALRGGTHTEGILAKAPGLRVAREAGNYPSGFRLSPCKVGHVFQDGESFEAAGLRFSAIHVRAEILGVLTH